MLETQLLSFFRNQNYLITTIFFLTVNNFLISLTLTKILLAWIDYVNIS